MPLGEWRFTLFRAQPHRSKVSPPQLVLGGVYCESPFNSIFLYFTPYVEGFTSILTHKQVDDFGFPQLAIGNKLPLSNVDILRKETQPPSYLTEAELIKMVLYYFFHFKNP